MNQKILHKICSHIEELLSEKEQVMIAIDGNSAAGKTTLSTILQSKFDCNIFHMDAFFLRAEQRTEKRLSAPGGNVDYERFQSEVLKPLRINKTFSYRPYDCRTQTLADPIMVQPSKLNIIEGVYSLHPYFGEIYDYKIFLSLESEEQKRRIIERDGEQKYKRFINEWIPMEKKYFEEYKIKSKCNLIV